MKVKVSCHKSLLFNIVLHFFFKRNGLSYFHYGQISKVQHMRPK